MTTEISVSTANEDNNDTGNLVKSTGTPVLTDGASTQTTITKLVTKPVRCVLLEMSNYFSWEAQFSAMLRGFQLMEYVLGEVELSTPARIQQDQLILSWILTGVSTSILPQIASYRTVSRAWLALQRLYAFGTQTRQIHIRRQLQSVQKGGLSMDEYITKVTVLRDSLAAIGESIKESEMILITLTGLGDDYKAFVTAITARYDPELTFSHLCELLMDQDLRLAKSRIAGIQVANVAVNQTTPDNTAVEGSHVRRV